MKVELGKFAREGLKLYGSGDLAADVVAALRLYLARRGVDPAVAPPAPVGVLVSVETVAIEVDPGPELRLALELEAEGAGISQEALVLHAVLVYLAVRDREETPERKAVQL